MVVWVNLCVLSLLQIDFEARQNGKNEPLELADGVALARAERTEANHRVLHFFTGFHELGVDKSVVFEFL